jgi:hypothetical protein
MKALLLLSAVATASAAASLGAQGTASKADSACTTYPGGRVECRIYRAGRGDSLTRGRFFFDMDSAMSKRAALGLEVRSTGTKRDTLGVFVDAVTPKGPAETAGIVEGDRIVAINGVDLRTSTADTEDSYTNGIAAHRLTREVQKLTPGARVTLRVNSGGRIRDVQVTAGKALEVMRLGGRMAMPGMEGMMRFDGPDGGGMIFGPQMEMLRGLSRVFPKEPMLRGSPQRIQLRSPMRYRTLSPMRTRLPQAYKVERGSDDEGFSVQDDDGAGESGWIEMDEPFTYEFDAPSIELEDVPVDIEPDIDPMPVQEIRDLAAITIRDARVALEQLAAAGVA